MRYPSYREGVPACLEAEDAVAELLADKPKDKWGFHAPADRREAEEITRHLLIEFPTPPKDQNPEPPDDLRIAQTRASRE